MCGAVTPCLFHAVLKHFVPCPPVLQPCCLLTPSCIWLQMNEAHSVSLLNCTYFVIYQGWCCKHWRSSQFCSIKDSTGFWWLYIHNPSKKRDGYLKYIILAFSSQHSHAYRVSQTLAVKMPSTLHLFYSSLKQRVTRMGILYRTVWVVSYMSIRCNMNDHLIAKACLLCCPFFRAESKYHI